MQLTNSEQEGATSKDVDRSMQYWIEDLERDINSFKEYFE